MKMNNVNQGGKQPGTEPPVRRKPAQPGIDSNDEAETEAAEEAIEMMRAVEHPGEFPPPPARKRSKKTS